MRQSSHQLFINFLSYPFRQISRILKYRKTGRARSFGVEMRCDIILPKKLPVKDYEFASVIANLLENAIIHVKDLKEDKRYVDVKI